MRIVLLGIILLAIVALHVSVPDSTHSILASIESENKLLRDEIIRLRLFKYTPYTASHSISTVYHASIHVLDQFLLMDLLYKASLPFQSMSVQLLRTGSRSYARL